jgi:hypothetical protein
MMISLLIALLILNYAYAGTESRDRQDETFAKSGGAAMDDANHAPAAPEPINANSVSTRIIPALRLFSARQNSSVADLAQQIEGLATRLGMAQIRAGGDVDGPLHILFEFGPGGIDDQAEVMLAFPTRGNPRSSGRYQKFTTPEFRCSYRKYEGPADGMSSAWAELARATTGAGHSLNGQARLVFSCDGHCPKERLSAELQLGIE